MGELSSDNDEAEDHSLRPNNFEKKQVLRSALSSMESWCPNWKAHLERYPNWWFDRGKD
jgi:hypothetical protein